MGTGPKTRLPREAQPPVAQKILPAHVVAAATQNT